MILTKEILNQGRSINGSWSRKQLASLGVSWPLESGWKEFIVGKDFHYVDIEKFLALKDAHLSANKKKRILADKDKTRKLQAKYDREWIASRRKPLTLDEAAKRLNDDKVWSEASKGFRDIEKP